MKKIYLQSYTSFEDLDIFSWPMFCRDEGSADEDNDAKKEKEVNITDRSCASTPTAPKRCKTRIPELTRPNIVCLLSKNGVGASVIKNCEPK